MGSVDAVGGSSLAAQLASTQSRGAQGVQGGHRHHHHRGEVTGSAAKALGMSDQDVSSALKSGKSLDDLAEEKGISHNDLVSAIKAGLPTRVQQSGRADQIAESIATRTGPPQRPAPPSGTAPAGSEGDAVSTVLGSLQDGSRRSTLDG